MKKLSENKFNGFYIFRFIFAIYSNFSYLYLYLFDFFFGGLLLIFLNLKNIRKIAKTELKAEKQNRLFEYLNVLMKKKTTTNRTVIDKFKLMESGTHTAHYRLFC